MSTIYMTRKEIIDDLSSVFSEQNDFTVMNDKELASAWVSYGIHAGTEDFDNVFVHYQNLEDKDKKNMISEDERMSSRIEIGESIVVIRAANNTIAIKQGSDMIFLSLNELRVIAGIV